MPTPAMRADQIRAEYKAKLIGRETAVAALRQVLRVSDAGAVDLLDHPQSPSERYTEVSNEAR